MLGLSYLYEAKTHMYFGAQYFESNGVLKVLD